MALLLVTTVRAAAAVEAPTAPWGAACRLPQAEIHFNHLPTLGEFDGSQMRFASVDARYYPPALGGLSVGDVSATLPIDFPVDGSRIRFFYVLDNQGRYDNDSSGLVGCMYFRMHGKSYVLSNAYEPEGNSTPIVTSMFTLDLARGVGRTLFVVVRYDIDSGGGNETSYELHAYGVENITKKESENDWTNFELYDFITKVLGNNSWNLTGNETTQSVHAYVDKASIVKRFKQLGYLK